MEVKISSVTSGHPELSVMLSLSAHAVLSTAPSLSPHPPAVPADVSFHHLHHDERQAGGRQGGDAGEGERGENQPGGAIRPPPLPGRPLPERECQLLAGNRLPASMFDPTNISSDRQSELRL